MLESLTNKVAGLRAYNFIKKKLQHVKHVKHVKFAKFLRTHVFTDTSYFEEHLRTITYRVFNVIHLFIYLFALYL